jgi:DNA-binding response OmpR family regulator
MKKLERMTPYSHVQQLHSPVTTVMPSTTSAISTAYLPTELLILGHDGLLEQSLDEAVMEYPVDIIPVRNAAAALNILGNREATAVLINLPALGLAAYDACAEIRNASLIPIIMISSDKRLEELVASYEAGADHYIVMPFAPAEVFARIGATKRRMQYAEPVHTHIMQGDLLLDPVRQEVHINDMMIELTTNESRLLHYLIRNPNRAVRTEDLLQLLWGEGTKEDLSVVRTTMHRLRNKIERNPSSPKYLKTVFGLGYRFCV